MVHDPRASGGGAAPRCLPRQPSLAIVALLLLLLLAFLSLASDRGSFVLPAWAWGPAAGEARTGGQALEREGRENNGADEDAEDQAHENAAPLCTFTAHLVPGCTCAVALRATNGKP